MVSVNFINNYDAAYDDYESVYETLIELTLKQLNKRYDYEISITLCNNEFIQQMNLEYRQKDYPTDVITFENDPILIKGVPIDLGDIFISVDQALIQAQEYQHSIEREMSFLLVHGVLHTLGYDHLDEDSEKVMFDLQEVILDEYKQKTIN